MKIWKYILLFFMITGCAKENYELVEPGQTTGLTVKQNRGTLSGLVASDEPVNRFIDQVDSNSILLSDKAPDIDQMLPGKIIFANPDSRNPNGFIRKIISRQEIDGAVLFTTRDAGIEEAFDNLQIEASYFLDGADVFKNLDIQSSSLGDFFLPLDVNDPRVAIKLSPTFGAQGNIVYHLVADFQAGRLDTLRFGVEDFVLKLTLKSEYNGAISGSKSLDFPLNLPIVFAIPIGKIIVTINARLLLKLEGSVSASGQIGTEFSIENKPVTCLLFFDNSIGSGSYKEKMDENPNNDTTDLKANLKITNASSSLKLGMGIPVSLEMAPYAAFDLANVGVTFNLAEVETNFTPRIDLGQPVVDAASTLTTSLSAGVSVDFIKKILKNQSLTATYNYVIWEKVFDLGQQTYRFPCTKEFGSSFFNYECIETADGERVQFTFYADLASGDANSGFKLFLGEDELGNYTYGKEHTRITQPDSSNYFTSITIRDNESTGCRLTWNIPNPCNLNVVCDGAPIPDPRDNTEYCFKNMANGTRWMTTNVKFNNFNTLGLCHPKDMDCQIFGRYYTYEQALTACPPGWRLPTVQEWTDMLQAERQANPARTFRRLFFPGLNNFHNVSIQEAQGFNLIPGGQFQGWNPDDSNQPKFTGSRFDENPDLLFWTSDRVFGGEGNPEFLSTGAKAIRITLSSFVAVNTPQNTGLNCRCVRD